MNAMKSYPWVLAAAGGALLLVGCQSTQQTSSIQQIPQITKLVEKATASPGVHRFRKPLRDERARTLRMLAAECDRLAGGRVEGVSAEALAGSTSGSLEAALVQLAAAARSGDVRAIRSNHSAALAAYSLAKSRTAPDP